MSQALYDHGGLRFWSESEIDARESAIKSLALAIRNALPQEWAMHRCEGPILSPRSEISESYDDNDIFVTNHKDFCLRAETTPSSYAYARHILKRNPGLKLPLCVWQSGISSRREKNDGASASKLRFNSFYQIEFQCVMPLLEKRTDGKLRAKLMDAVRPVIDRVTGAQSTIEDSDRLPSYSESTKDIMCGREVASCSIRTDFSDLTRVVEIAIGLDRLIEIGGY